LFRSITAEEFKRERTVHLANDHFELQRHDRNQPWIVRNVLPLNYASYCVVSLPWEATFDGDSHLFFDFGEAYRFLKKPVPQPLTLSRWHADFKLIEANREIPPALRETLSRHAALADLIFVRCSRSLDPPINYHWTIERSMFLELNDPFQEMPYQLGHFDIFPRGAAWYIAHRDDEPLLYVGGSAELVENIFVALPNHALPLRLDDRYF
jgi:hypothetical protein